MFMLMEQKDTITRLISIETSRSAEIINVIERLEKAALSIESNAQEMENSKIQISDLVIDSSLWRGSEKRTYKEQVSVYEEDVKNYSLV